MSQQPIYRSSKATQGNRSSSSLIWTLAICILIILAGVRYIFFNWKGNNNTDSDSLSGSALSGTTYYIGQKVLISGIITPVSAFTTYTHDFVAENGDQFGLKSKDIDLYQYSGSVDIKGEVTDFRKEMPLITVTEIVGSKAGTGISADILEGNPDYYFFKDEGIGFDLSISDGYTVEQQADEIVLIDLESGNQPETVLTIAPFICKAGDSLKDCSALQASFNERGNETYVTAHDITFYNLTETKTRVAFNKGRWYYVTPTEENQFTSFIDLMSYMSQERIQQAATENIATYCRDINQTMTQVTSTEFDYQPNGIVVVSMRGLDSYDNEVGCQVAVRLGNSLKVVPVNFTPTEGAVSTKPTQVVVTGSTTATPTWSTTSTTTTTTPQTDTGDDNTQEIADTPWITPPVQETTPTNYDGWLSHPSVRWYTIYFSNKSISFAGKIIDKIDLGISGLSCNYELNIIQWQRAEEVDINPDVVVYECKGAPSNSQLAAKNLQHIGTTGDLVFIAKFLTNNLGSFQIDVQ